MAYISQNKMESTPSNQAHCPSPSSSPAPQVVTYLHMSHSSWKPHQRPNHSKQQNHRRDHDRNRKRTSNSLESPILTRVPRHALHGREESLPHISIIGRHNADSSLLLLRPLLLLHSHICRAVELLPPDKGHHVWASDPSSLQF
jgi:hypothetical protein